MASDSPKILIAGVGNELRQDDAFGMVLARQLLDDAELPSSVTVVEIGTAGMHLVQQLFDRYDILMILDTVQWGGEPGTVYLKQADVKDILQMPAEEKNSFLADMHYINPIKALMMAKALNVIPEKVYFLGCEAADHEDIDIGMSALVSNAIPAAYTRVLEWLYSVVK